MPKVTKELKVRLSIYTDIPTAETLVKLSEANNRGDISAAARELWKDGLEYRRTSLGQNPI